MKVQKIPETFDAAQWLGNNPKEILEIWEKAQFKEDDCLIPDGHGIHLVAKKQWIVVHRPLNLVEILSDTDFREQYEPEARARRRALGPYLEYVPIRKRH